MKRTATGVAILALLGGGPAFAATSYQGDDFTRDLNRVREVMVCDQESDSRGVRGDYVVNGSASIKTIYDGNGAKNSCDHSGTFSAKIYRHRAVEIVPVGNDAEGSWVYPT